MTTVYLDDGRNPGGYWPNWNYALYAGSPVADNWPLVLHRHGEKIDSPPQGTLTLRAGDRVGTTMQGGFHYKWSEEAWSDVYVELWVRGSGSARIDFAPDIDWNEYHIYRTSDEDVYVPPDYETTRKGGEAYHEGEWGESQTVTGQGDGWTLVRLTAPSSMTDKTYIDEIGQTAVRVVGVSGEITIGPLVAVVVGENGVLLRNGDDKYTEWRESGTGSRNEFGSLYARSKTARPVADPDAYPAAVGYDPAPYPPTTAQVMEVYNLVRGRREGLPVSSTYQQGTYFLSGQTGNAGKGFYQPGRAQLVAAVSAFKGHYATWWPYNWIEPRYTIIADLHGMNPTTNENVATFMELLPAALKHSRMNYRPPNWSKEQTDAGMVRYVHFDGPDWESDEVEFLGWEPISINITRTSYGVTNNSDIAADFGEPYYPLMSVNFRDLTGVWRHGDPLPPMTAGKIVATYGPTDMGRKSFIWYPPKSMYLSWQYEHFGGLGVAEGSIGGTTYQGVPGTEYPRIEWKFKYPRHRVRILGYETYVAPGRFKIYAEGMWKHVGNQSWDDGNGRLKVRVPTSISPSGWAMEVKPGDDTTNAFNWPIRLNLDEPRTVVRMIPAP